MLARESDMMFTFIWGNVTDLCSLPNSPGVQHSFNPVMEFDESSENYLICRDIGDLQRQWDILEDYYEWWWENHWAIGTVTWGHVLANRAEGRGVGAGTRRHDVPELDPHGSSGEVT